MKETKNFDAILKELGDLYEFNRQIRKFSFKYPAQKDTSSGIISEDSTKYEVRNTHK